MALAGVGSSISFLELKHILSNQYFDIWCSRRLPLQSLKCMEILEHSTKSNLESSSRRSTHSQPRKRTAAAAS